MTGTSFVSELVPLRGENEFEPHPQSFWYLLGVLFKIVDDHPRHFYMGGPPPRPGGPGDVLRQASLHLQHGMTNPPGPKAQPSFTTETR